MRKMALIFKVFCFWFCFELSVELMFLLSSRVILSKSSWNWLFECKTVACRRCYDFKCRAYKSYSFDLIKDVQDELVDGSRSEVEHGLEYKQVGFSRTS